MGSDDKTRMPKPVKNILLSDNFPDDRAVLAEIREVCRMIPGVRPKGYLINLLSRILPEEKKRIQESGGQLLAG